MAGQELQTVDEQPNFGRPLVPSSVNAGSVSIEQERAIAEVQGQLILAKRFPRDLNEAYAEVMQSCKLMAMASVAFYKVPRGGGSVTGPSIRLAEELARVCGNLDHGHRELSRDHEKSEVEVFAWDKQTNTRVTRQLTVMHVLDTRDGPRKLRDQKEVDDLIANKASKQKRGLILSIIPAWLKEAAIEQCKQTLAGGGGKTIPERVRGMTDAFAKYGVTVAHLEAHLNHKLDQTVADELVDLHAIFEAIKGGEKASDYFGAEAAAEKTPEDAAAAAAGRKAIADARKQQAKKDPPPADAADKDTGKTKAKPEESGPAEADERRTEVPAEPAQTDQAPADDDTGGEPEGQQDADPEDASVF